MIFEVQEVPGVLKDWGKKNRHWEWQPLKSVKPRGEAERPGWSSEATVAGTESSDFTHGFPPALHLPHHYPPRHCLHTTYSEASRPPGPWLDASVCLLHTSRLSCHCIAPKQSFPIDLLSSSPMPHLSTVAAPGFNVCI